jgi:protein-disulfide isomerase
MERLEQDMASGEVNTTLNEDMRLAKLIGATGTPNYVVGKTMVVDVVSMQLAIILQTEGRRKAAS